MTDLNAFVKWVEEQPKTRSVQIAIQTKDRWKEPVVVDAVAWAYDTNLMVGQHVHSVSEIDLLKRQEAAEREQYAKLKAKFEVRDESLSVS